MILPGVSYICSDSKRSMIQRVSVTAIVGHTDEYLVPIYRLVNSFGSEMSFVDSAFASEDAGELQCISRIETIWSVVVQSRPENNGGDATAARALLAERYMGAIARYLHRLLKNHDDATDVAQDVLTRMLAGKLSNADPTRGRFRDYVKTTVLNEVRQFIRKSKLRNSVLHLRDIDLLEATDEPVNDPWQACVTAEILRRSELRLEAWCKDDDQPFAMILRWKKSNPTADSKTLAEFLSKLLERQISPPNARKLVQRSREKLAEFIVAGVMETLPAKQRTRQAVEEELIDLQLHSHCQTVLPQFFPEP